MSDYIKREDAIDAVTHEWQIFNGVLAIEYIPPADVVEVVRCKDCNNADYAGCPKGRCYCMEHGTYFNSDDYCSYGENQEQEHECK